MVLSLDRTLGHCINCRIVNCWGRTSEKTNKIKYASTFEKQVKYRLVGINLLEKLLKMNHFKNFHTSSNLVLLLLSLYPSLGVRTTGERARGTDSACHGQLHC